MLSFQPQCVVDTDRCAIRLASVIACRVSARDAALARVAVRKNVLELLRHCAFYLVDAHETLLLRACFQFRSFDAQPIVDCDSESCLEAADERSVFCR